jgi:hypothetical protein
MAETLRDTVRRRSEQSRHSSPSNFRCAAEALAPDFLHLSPPTQRLQPPAQGLSACRTREVGRNQISCGMSVQGVPCADLQKNQAAARACTRCFRQGDQATQGKNTAGNQRRGMADETRKPRPRDLVLSSFSISPSRISMSVPCASMARASHESAQVSAREGYLRRG